MKKSLILLVVFFATINVWGENTGIPLSDLRKGDWFMLQCIQHLPNQQNAPASDVDNVMTTLLRGEVTEKSGRQVRITFSLKHVYFNWQLHYTAPDLNGDFQNYFDSYYHENHLPVNQPVIIMDIPLHRKKDITYTLSDSTYSFGHETIRLGLKTASQHMKVRGSKVLNLVDYTQRALIPFLENRQTVTGAYSCSLTDASFALPPNLHLTYIPLRPLSEEDASLLLGKRKYPLTQEADGSYTAAVFLPRPARGWIGDSRIQVMPGDSLTIRQVTDKQFAYKGRGAADCAFYQEIARHRNFFFDYQSLWRLPTLQEIAERTRKGKDIYSELLSKYGKDMHPYWKESALCSQQYWEITIHLRACRMAQTKPSLTPEQVEQYDIPWMQAPYTKVTPFTDHLYQPWLFDEFLEAYFHYKAHQLDADNLTNKFYWGSGPDTYYLQKQIFSGYPQIYCLSENLKDMIRQGELSGIRREYEDFLSLCKNPEIAGEIEQQWQRYMLLEPGANIKDAGMHITSFLPLRKKANGYILLSESFVFGDAEDFNTNADIDRILTELNIKDKTTLCYLRPESRRQYLPDSLRGKKLYTFVPDRMIDEDKGRFNISPWAMIFMRNDGTILTRTIEKTPNDIQGLKEALEKAIRQPKAEKKYSKSEVYGFILGFLVFFLLAFTVVFIRFKRMRLMRKFTELRLKAIRSQMNPHFIFNALGSIQSLILQGKNEAANRYLTDFSKLLRMVLSNSDKQLIPLSDEIRLLRLYLKIEQLRTPFEFEINVDTSVDSDQEEIPGMLLQPIVENAVIHGIVPQGGGRIELRFYKQDQILYAEISDNGSGFQPTATDTSTRQHFGIRSISDRLKLLNETCHAQIGITVQNRREEGGRGCRVIISIPV